MLLALAQFGSVLALWSPPADPAPGTDERARDEFAPVEIIIVAPGERGVSPTQPDASDEAGEQGQGEQGQGELGQAPAEQPPVEPPPPELVEPEPLDEEVPLDDEVPLDEDLEEIDDGSEALDEDQVRTVIVDASVLGKGDAYDVFSHAGGRTVVDATQVRERGATSVGEAVARAPGVRAVQGNSGIGSQDSALQVAVRGANPRLSSRATVLLDEIPIAPAPYGQPQLSLFPISLFSIAEIDVVRGGATARYGPQTSGGVFNLVSNPIPEHPSVAVFAQGDSNRDFSLGTAYGATHGRFGMYIEYAPRFGRSYREHSDKVIHGGLAKFAWQFNPRVRLESLTHAYYEDSELPGGLWREDYDQDPFQSRRPFDYFRGSRAGTALKLSWQISDRQDLKVSGWYSHSYRTTYLASERGDDPAFIENFQDRPRYYDVMGVEPRWTMRFDSKRFDFSHQLSAGARAGYEIGRIYTYLEDVDGELLTEDFDSRTAAYAAYVDEKFIFLDGDLAIDVGVRLEYIQMAGRSNLERTLLRRNYWAPLPAASVWYSPLEQLALFLSYGRSFGPPQFLQIAVSPNSERLEPELSNSVELGVKILELGGVYAESTAWYKDFDQYLDVGQEAFDLIDNIYIWGIESELEWYPSEIWDMYGEPSIYAGYGWTDSTMVGLTYTGNKMPWYPVHEAWAGVGYALDFGLALGVDVEYMGRQYTDLENREIETVPDAAFGPIPAYTLVNIWTRMQTPLPNGWRLEFGGGVKNVGDVRFFSRTDDRNAGILVGRPRTFYFNVGFAHDFLPKHMRSPKRERKQKAVAGRTNHRAQRRVVESLPL